MVGIKHYDKLTFVTHQEDILVSQKTGDVFSWMAMVAEHDEMYEVWVTLIRLDEDPAKCQSFKSERLYQTKQEAQNYIRKTLRHFPKFSFRILETDEYYDDYVLSEKVGEWLNRDRE